MGYYRRIIYFIKPYKKEVVATFALNILTVIFSIVSIAALIPVLQIIFDSTNTQYEAVPYTGIGDLKDYLKGNVNYYITTELERTSKKALLLKVILFTGILFIFKNLFRYLARLALTLVQNGVEQDIRNKIHKKILELDLAFYARNRKGDLLARITSDLHEIQWAILATIHKMVQEPLMILGTLGALFIFSTRLTLFVLILFPLAAFIITFVGKKLKKPSERAKEELGRIVSLMEEHLTGLLIIKSFQAEERMYKSFRESNEKYKKNMDQMLFLRELSSPISEILGFAVIASVIWYGGYLILDENSLQPSVFIAYIILFYQIISPAKSLSNAIYDINRAEASSKRVLDLLETKNSLPEPAEPTPVHTVEKEIHFNQVSFSYGKESVLRDIEIRIPKGKTIALVGESGSGKSTLVSLLNRFYDVKEGAILIDGVDIRQFKKSELRRLFGYISQDAILFNDTIRRNLWIADPDASEEDMIKALKMANAWGFVKKMELGLDHSVGERGGGLSGGQRQRIAIARAILKNPPVMLLDEATSALDSASEQLVQEAFDRLLEGRTAIIIAHRLSTIQSADEIIVMKDGEIIERGTHIELVDFGGEYCKFVELQNV